MARYRKIDVRMFGDAKWRELSPLPACGQALWIHLLVGKQTKLIPGLFSIGRAAFAEQLGWKLGGFDCAFDEVSDHKMAYADWTAQLIFIPNAIKYNDPQNPNIVLGWSNEWDELPECELKLQAFKRYAEHFIARGPAFIKAFRSSCPEPVLSSDQMPTMIDVEPGHISPPPSAYLEDLEGFVDLSDRADWLLTTKPQTKAEMQAAAKDLVGTHAPAHTLDLPDPDPVPDSGNDSRNGLPNGSGNGSRNDSAPVRGDAFANRWGIGLTAEESELDAVAKPLFEYAVEVWAPAVFAWHNNAEFFRRAAVYCSANGTTPDDMRLLIDYIKAVKPEYANPKPVFGSERNIESWLNAANSWRAADDPGADDLERLIG